MISLGEDIVEAITKKRSNRNTKSVMELIANVASTLFRLFNAIKVMGYGLRVTGYGLRVTGYG